jgi:hypothetical protein
MIQTNSGMRASVIPLVRMLMVVATTFNAVSVLPMPPRMMPMIQ